VENIQLFGKNLSVARTLIQHIDMSLFSRCSQPLGCSKVFDVLRDYGRDSAPFSETLPDFNGISCRLTLFKQKVHFINKYRVDLWISRLMSPVPDLILYDEHTDLFELFAELLDVIGNRSLRNIHIGTVITRHSANQ
jgi:hypothetical protein